MSDMFVAYFSNRLSGHIVVCPDNEDAFGGGLPLNHDGIIAEGTQEHCERIARERIAKIREAGGRADLDVYTPF